MTPIPMPKLSKLVQLSAAFSAEVNLSRDFSYSIKKEDSKITGYLPNQSSRRIMRAVLGTVATNTDQKAHLIQASYGTGKSYLLLMLANILGNAGSAALTELRRKIEDKDNEYGDKLGQELATHESQEKLLVVIPNYGAKDFNHALLQALNDALKSEKVPYIPATNYRRAAHLIELWKKDNSANYTKLAQILSGVPPEQFIQLLHNTDQTAYASFKDYFKSIVGTEFSENHADDVFMVFSETAKAIQAFGIRGIAVFYDEFGDMLSRMINSPEGSGSAVQDFLEKIKDPYTSKGNILFLAATHQDVAALGAFKKDEVEKVRARFMMHRLDVTETEAEEILSTVFIHPDKEAFESLLEESYIKGETKRIEEFTLYPNRDKTWVKQKILYGLHPLHPLTAFVLPRLSAEFAQNTRSMFNFLSPNQLDSEALMSYLDKSEAKEADGRPTVFTVDKLFGFFEKNLSEAKSESVQSWLDAYRTTMGKVSEQSELERLFKAVLLLTVVKIDKIRPRRDVLFWAMNWPFVKRLDFENLLAELVKSERLEFNPTDEVFEFPASGAKSVSKVIEEEKQKIGSLPLNKCVVIWEALVPHNAVEAQAQKLKYGANRHFSVVVALESAQLQIPIEKLKKYYSSKDSEYYGNGIIAYLLSEKEADLAKLQLLLSSTKEVQPYLFYAKLKDQELTKDLLDRTLLLQALEATLKRVDISSNPAREQNVRNQRNKTQEDVVRDIKSLYKAENWLWQSGSSSNPPLEFKSSASFIKWFDIQVDELFPETCVPVVKDEALWFKAGEAASRRKALAEIVEAGKDSIPLDVRDGNKNAAHNRIIRNFFQDLELTVDRKTLNKNQLGEIKNPVANTPAAGIFKLFDSIIRDKTNVAPTDLLIPLLRAPYGLSRSLTKFLFACYVRLNRDQTQISDAKRSFPLDKTPELLEKIFDKPDEYRLRYFAISGPQARYLKRLRELFENEKADTFGEVAKKFEALLNFMSPLKKELAHTQKGSQVSTFYQLLESLRVELAASGVNKEDISKEFFIKTLPDTFLHITEAQLEDGFEHIEELTKLIRKFIDYPGIEERNFKMASLALMASQVFKADISQKDDIKGVVQAWFKTLPPANQLSSTDYGNPKIHKWLDSARSFPANTDVFALYLEELDESGISNWDTNLLLHQANYVSLFKQYRTTVEAYTRDPVQVYQTIARSVFEVPSSECSTESAFVELWASWWKALPQLTRDHVFGEPLVTCVLDRLDLAILPKEKFLASIPQAWREKGLLISTVPAQWEEWSAMHTNKVADLYLEARQRVETWQPPVTEAGFFEAVGKVFELSTLTLTEETLRKGLKDQWLPTLPNRTLQATWSDSNSLESLWLESLKKDLPLYKLLTVQLPIRWQVNSLKEMTDESLALFMSKLEQLKSVIEAYQRPITEVLEAITKLKHEGSADYQMWLYNTISATEAYKNQAEKEDELLQEPLDRLILTSARSRHPLSKLIAEAATQQGLTAHHHAWTKQQQDEFVATFKNALSRLKAWKFPVDRNLEKAVQELALQAKFAGDTYKLTKTQLRKVLQDVIATL
jgi:hypothetical protein